MGKKKSSGVKYTSQGTVGTNRTISRIMRAERSELDRYMAQMAAFRKGKNVVFTIPNPNPNETNKLFIRVRGKDLLGDWRAKS